jgi:hypothetical protein
MDKSVPTSSHYSFLLILCPRPAVVHRGCRRGPGRHQSLAPGQFFIEGYFRRERQHSLVNGLDPGICAIKHALIEKRDEQKAAGQRQESP